MHIYIYIYVCIYVWTYICICKDVSARVQLPCSKRSFKSRSSGEDNKPASFSALASVSSLMTLAADRRRFFGLDGCGPVGAAAADLDVACAAHCPSRYTRAPQSPHGWVITPSSHD